MKNEKVILFAFPIFSALGVITLSLFIFSTANATSGVPFSNSTELNEDAVDRWQILVDMNADRLHPGIVIVNDEIHVIGGFGDSVGTIRSSQEVYNPQTRNWQYKTPTPVPISDFVAVNIGDKIYVIGGYNVDLGGTLDLNHMYDPVADTWDTTKQSLPISVSGAAGVFLNDKIYILGGYNRDDLKISNVQIYNPASDTWSEGTPMNMPRSEFGAVVLNGLIYAIGGQPANNLNDVEIYDPVSDSWVEGPELPERRANMAVTVRQGKIYVIGGVEFESQPNDVKDTIFEFDPATNMWLIGAPMPTARRGCRAAVISDIIYVIGGNGELGAGTANEAYGPFPSPVFLPLVNR